MRRNVFTWVKALTITALAVGLTWSCQEEKPEIYIPEAPVPTFYIESYLPDTATVCVDDTLVLQFRTAPYDMLKRDSIGIEIIDTYDATYKYATLLNQPTLGKDSIWSLSFHILKGMSNGDVVRLKVTDRLVDTIWHSAPIVLKKVFRAIQTVSADSITFTEGELALLQIRTTPSNLLNRLPKDSLSLVDSTGAKYEFADVQSLVLNDGIWDISLQMKYGMVPGDIVKLKIADKDTVLYSNPIVLNMILLPPPTVYGIQIASGRVAAFEAGGVRVTVRIRTTPWNVLLEESSAKLSLTDTLGNPISEFFSIQNREFMPDSTWALKISLLDNNLDSAAIAVRMTVPDTTVSSTPVTIKRVSFEMTSVLLNNGKKMQFNSTTKTYSFCLPTVTDFSTSKFKFTHTGDKLMLGDTVLVNDAYNVIDASKPVTVSLWKYDLHKEYTLKVTNTGLPVVRINTYGKTVTRRDTWVGSPSEGFNSIRIELPDGTVAFESDSLSLKGRGNGTWTETAKKPYALKLSSKAKILGMDKSKRWCLLANYKDRTLLRNDAALWISRHTDMPFTVQGRYVELVWNGDHMGNYYLCQQIRIENGRVEIADPNLSDPANGGMLVVIDDFLGYSSSDRQDKSPMVGFRSTGSGNRYKLPYVLKDPEEDANGNLLTESSAPYQYLFNYVKDMEDAIYGLKTNPSSNWQQYLDIDRAVDYVLIQEITMNHDSYNTWPKAGPHSAYLYKDAGGKLCYGPVWDFDYHTFTLYNDAAYSSPSSGENPRIRQWELLKMDNKGGNKYYFADLVKYDSQFKARLLERWNEYKYVWRDSLPLYIDMMADSIRVSESYNDTRWVDNKSLSNYRQNGDYNLSFQEAVNAMKSAFRKRWDWIDQNLPTLCQ